MDAKPLAMDAKPLAMDAKPLAMDATRLETDATPLETATGVMSPPPVGHHLHLRSPGRHRQHRRPADRCHHQDGCCC
jgi:hypothetical protein